MRILTVIVFIYFSGLSFAQSVYKIDSVYFEGLKKTKLFYIQRFIQQTKDSAYNVSLLQSDVQSLLNTQYFSEVEQKIDTTGNKVVVKFILKERVTLLPLLDWGKVDGFNYYKGGFFNYHWLGKGGWLNAWYMHYERHSAGVYAYLPYIARSNFGWSLNLQNYGTIEPLYFDEGQVFYNYDNRSAENLVVYELKQNSFVKLGGTFFREEYSKNFGRSQGLENVGPNHKVFKKYLLKADVSENNIDYNYHYLDGHFVQSYLEYVKTIRYDNGFVKWVLDYKLFKRIGKKGNFGTRLNFGLASNHDSPFAPFVVDNYLNIRGVGNRVSRGTAQLVSNIEYRYTLLQPSWGAVQGVLFTDIGLWRMPGQKWRDVADVNNMKSFSGVGLRVFLNQFFNSILRIDYGKDLMSQKSGWVLGLGQYF